MKGIVEQYARGEFKVDRPVVAISVSRLELNIEAGTVYDGEFSVDTTNSCPVKLMVYDSRYILDFKSHTYVGRKIQCAIHLMPVDWNGANLLKVIST